MMDPIPNFCGALAKAVFDQVAGVAFWMSIFINTLIILVILGWPRRRD